MPDKPKPEPQCPKYPQSQIQPLLRKLEWTKEDWLYMLEVGIMTDDPIIVRAIQLREIRDRKLKTRD